MLSAYGIALADSVVEMQEPVDVSYSDDEGRFNAISNLRGLRKRCVGSLMDRGVVNDRIRCELYLNLRYEGTDFGIMMMCPDNQQGDVESVDFVELFVDEYTREHGFSIPDRNIVIDDVRVRALGQAVAGTATDAETVTLPAIQRGNDGGVVQYVEDAKPTMTTKSFFKDEGGWLEMCIWKTKDLPRGKAVLLGPCMIVDTDAGNTVVVDPGCVARIASDGNMLITVAVSNNAVSAASADAVNEGSASEHVDAVKLSIYAHRFTGISQQMRCKPQSKSISINIKDRLDFSCELFDETGCLVANGLHVPAHVGAMQDAVHFHQRELRNEWK